VAATMATLNHGDNNASRANHHHHRRFQSLPQRYKRAESVSDGGRVLAALQAEHARVVEQG
jgi:hypothetical protein